MDNNKKKWIIIFVSSILLLTIVITRCTQPPLPAYNGDGEVTPSPVATQEPISGITHTDKETGASFFIPDGWVYVLKGGVDTWIHKESTSCIQFQVQPYSPYLLYVHEESLNNEIDIVGGTLQEFCDISNREYTCSYTLNNMTYYERTAYDRDLSVRVVIMVPTAYQSLLNAEITQSLTSFRWNPNNPFPIGYDIYYNEYGSFEYAVPSDWYYGITENAFFAQSQSTGATMSVRVSESDVSYSDVDSVKFTAYTQENYPTFVLQDFANDSRIIYATGIFTSENERYVLIEYLLASGTFEYAIIFTCPYSSYDEEAQLYTDTIKLFRLI